MEEAIRYRLRMAEIIPVEMSRYTICECFSCRNMSGFSSNHSGRSCSLHSSKAIQYFFMPPRRCRRRRMVLYQCRILDEYRWRSDRLTRSDYRHCSKSLANYISIDFPRVPTGVIKRHITDEADARLRFYLPLRSLQPPIPMIPPRPQLPQGVVDAPLVRLYNFLRTSLSLPLHMPCFHFPQK